MKPCIAEIWSKVKHSDGIVLIIAAIAALVADYVPFDSDTIGNPADV